MSNLLHAVIFETIRISFTLILYIANLEPVSLAFRQEALLPLTAGHSMERPAFGVRPLLFHLSVFSQCFLNVFDNFFYFTFHNKNNFNVTANVKRDIFWQNLPLTK